MSCKKILIQFIDFSQISTISVLFLQFYTTKIKKYVYNDIDFPGRKFRFWKISIDFYGIILYYYFENAIRKDVKPDVRNHCTGKMHFMRSLRRPLPAKSHYPPKGRRTDRLQSLYRLPFVRQQMLYPRNPCHISDFLPCKSADLCYTGF